MSGAAASSPSRSSRAWLLSAFVGLVGVVALAGANFASYASTRWTDRTLEVRKETQEWLATLLEADVAVRALVARDTPEARESYEHALAQEAVQATLVQGLVADNETEVVSVTLAGHEAQIFRDWLQAVGTLAEAGHRDEALARLVADTVESLRGAFRLQTDRIYAEEDRLLAERRSQASVRRLVTSVGALLLILASASFLMGAWRREKIHQAAVSRLATEAQSRLEMLSHLATALADTRSRAQVAETVIEQGMRVAGADTCTLYMMDEEGTALELIGDRGVAPEVIDKVRRITETMGAPETFASAKAGTPRWAESDAEYAAMHPGLARMSEHRARAFWSVPLIAEDRTVGLLGAGFYQPRSFSADERALVQTLAHQCAQALVRALRLERQDEARRRLAMARTRSDFLSRTGEELVASLDYEATLATVAQLAVPDIADWCAVDLAEHGGSGRPVPRRVATAHVDPTKVALARGFVERYPRDPDASTGVARVIRTGESELYTELPREQIEASAKDETHRQMLRDLQLESAMVVALRARGHTFGAVTFVYAQSGRRYGRDDLAFAEDFARRAAMAIENALALRAAEDAREKERGLRASAELASRAKDDFLATVSHELRTPLHAILAWAVTLRSRQPPEGIDRGLIVIERNARAQAKLIEDILDVSRIISGKLALNVSPTVVADAVSAAIETVTPAAVAKDIVIESEVADRAETIVADPDRLQQIVWNLVSNAVKFTPKGGRVAVRVNREGSDVYIRVSDNGEGIRPAVLPVVFERFQQADASTTRRHGGLGLGLAIVKQLVAAHGGSVSADSPGPGLGATFVVQLPARSLVPAVRKSVPPPATAAVAPVLSKGPRLDGLRLLVIDDEHDAREVVGEVLRERGAEVELAGSAAEAMDKFAVLRPDVVVSDIGMPGADGYTLIRRIRALSADDGGRTPAIALTAYSRAEDAQRAFVAGYQMHVAKPIEPAQLATVVANLGGIALDES
jgi:signal transduction histidine kinase/CheY-like chemotaxis protein/CHASE3 domain sensor protein